MEGRTEIPYRKRKSSDGDSMSSESSGSDSDYGTLEGTDRVLDRTDRVPLMKMVYCNAEDLECDMPAIALERYAKECSFVYVPQDLPQGS